ncbi:hypothetical protein [Variovorax sp. V15]|uniref:hypothetical protein n=1 Tax=Variovorax sp. V15 TaxID=3065952 RepID=UPI0034E8D9D9
MRHIPSRTGRRYLQAVATTASLLAGAVSAQPLQIAAVGNNTPLELLLTDTVRQVPYNPYASQPGVRWKNGKDAGPEAEGTIELPGAGGKPSVQAVLSVERDAQGRTTSVGVLIPSAGRQKPSTQFREILRQQLEPGATVTLIADNCAWDEGGMEPWSKDVFMRLNWPGERRALFVRGRLKAWPDASSSAIHSAFFFDAEDPSQLIEQMGCKRAKQP